jgi:uncharacterized protein YbjT (DUF2867 family)
MILVTAAFGNQGRRLIPRLASAGARVRALRHAPDGAPALQALGATEVIIGDAADAGALRGAMSGIDAVYHIGPSAHPLGAGCRVARRLTERRGPLRTRRYSGRFSGVNFENPSLVVAFSATCTGPVPFRGLVEISASQ